MRPRQWIRHWPMLALGALLVAGAVAVVVAATGAARPADASAVQAEIRAVAVMRDQALVDADMAALEKIHARDYQLITPDGTVLSRADFLGSVASRDLDYLTFRAISPIRVRMLGDNAAAVRTAVRPLAGRLVSGDPGWIVARAGYATFVTTTRRDVPAAASTAGAELEWNEPPVAGSCPGPDHSVRGL